MENEFINRIKNLEKQIDEIGRNRQIYQGDWISLNTSEIVPDTVTENLFNTTRDFTNIISIGTKIRIFGAGDYSFFYVVSITANSIGINAGDDFVFNSSSDYYSFEYSNASSPIGHPLIFNYTPIITGSGGSGTLPTFATNLSRFSIIDRTVFVSVFLQNSSGGTAGSGTIQLLLSTPTAMGTVNTVLGIGQTKSSSTTFIGGCYKFGVTTFSINSTINNPIVSGDFSSSDRNLTANLNYFIV